jgi:molybdate transport system permease protein
LPEAVSDPAAARARTGRARTRSERLVARVWPVLAGLLAGALVLLVALPLAGLLFTASPRQLLAGLGDPLVGPAVRLTLLTTTASLALIVACGTPLAWLIARRRTRAVRVLETVLELPVVLPPAVAGVALLLAFGRRGLLGQTLAAVGIGLPFSRAAVVLAETFVAAPFYVQAAVTAFRRLDPDLVLVARTLGASWARVFFTVAVPISRAALAGGAAMSWARALGEFGATLMFAGNMVGRTQTLPLAIYTALESDLQTAQSLSIILVAVALALLAAVRAGARP